jgi:hypothetical protein
MAAARELRLRVGEGDVSAIAVRPTEARALLVLAHGAGAGMRHPFLQSLAAHLADAGIASLRYQFPYAEQGRRRPDPEPLLLATVRAAVAEAAGQARGLPLLAGGKSMGGRMTSLAAAEAGLAGVAGLVFFGFPLHAAGHPSAERGKHLAKVGLPMLFLQGTRDRLADLALLRPLCRRLAPRATLHVVEGGDHSFALPRRAGRSPDDVHRELARAVADWAAALPAAAG